MRKIPTLFCRNHDGDRLVRDEIEPGCEWVPAGEGVPTEKIDGTCCMVRDGALFGRYTLRRGKNPPAAFEPATEVDPVTGKQEGWVPVGDGPEWAAHREAFAATPLLPDFTYELVGPKVQSNPYQLFGHHLWRHGANIMPDYAIGRTFGSIREFLFNNPVEGIVWWHEDGRMVKIKRRDFGLAWPRIR